VVRPYFLSGKELKYYGIVIDPDHQIDKVYEQNNQIVFAVMSILSAKDEGYK